jgi:hypothetical protein
MSFWEKCVAHSAEQCLRCVEDSIKHPKHYTSGAIECWDYIVSQNLGFLEGNIIKYVTRWKHKNGVEDLKKAKAYLEKLIAEASK